MNGPGVTEARSPNDAVNGESACSLASSKKVDPEANNAGKHYDIHR